MRAVVMGGTTGIGRATAERLVTDGAEVIVTGRDEGRLAAIRPGVAEAVALDGTDDNAVAEFFARVGEFDHLVLTLSPGPVGIGPLAAVSAADLRTAFDGKLFAYLSAVQQAQTTRSITMISAASARAAVPGTVVLAAVNGALERIVSPLAAELAPVRVNAVSPGVIDTDWWSFLADDQRKAQFAQAEASLPVSRVGQPEDVARAVAYLVAADYVTGSILPVDGGFTVA